MVDVAIPRDSNIRKMEHKKLEKCQGLKEELERMWGVKASVVPRVIGAHGAVTHKLGDWLQQIPGITPDTSVQKSTILDPIDHVYTKSFLNSISYKLGSLNAY